MSMATSMRNAINPVYLPQYDPYKHLIVYDAGFHIGSGTELIDLSPYRSHGTTSNTTWLAGTKYPCLDFDPAEPSYVEIAATYDQLDFTSEDFSIVARIYVDNLLADDTMIFCRGAWKVDGYYFHLYANGALNFKTNQSVAIQGTYSASGAITTGSWLTLGVSRDGSSVKIFKNGQDISDTIGTHIDPATSSRSAKVGIYDDKSSYAIDAKMEFLRIWKDIALPATDHLWYHNRLK